MTVLVGLHLTNLFKGVAVLLVKLNGNILVKLFVILALTVGIIPVTVIPYSTLKAAGEDGLVNEARVKIGKMIVEIFINGIGTVRIGQLIVCGKIDILLGINGIVLKNGGVLSVCNGIGVGIDGNVLLLIIGKHHAVKLTVAVLNDHYLIGTGSKIGELIVAVLIGCGRKLLVTVHYRIIGIAILLEELDGNVLVKLLILCTLAVCKPLVAVIPDSAAQAA